jgi:hypothetical protein
VLRLNRERDGYSAYRFSIMGQSEAISLLVTRKRPCRHFAFGLSAARKVSERASSCSCGDGLQLANHPEQPSPGI